jgi:hypothetical protein
VKEMVKYIAYIGSCKQLRPASVKILLEASRVLVIIRMRKGF